LDASTRPKRTRAVEKAGEAFAVGRQTVHDAGRVLASGKQDVIEAVEHGDITINQALGQADLLAPLTPRREAQACCTEIKRRMMLLPPEGRQEFAAIMRDFTAALVEPSRTTTRRKPHAEKPGSKARGRKAPATTQDA
jgi:hypothetical protein